ncbi:hypothetical protein Tco_1357770 [Tanacetum coccineum]
MKRTPQKKKEKVFGAKEAEEKENVASVEKAIIAEEVEKMLKGYEEDDSEFLDSLLLSQEDPDTRLEHGSYKKSPEEKKDVDDDHHHHIDDSLVKKKNMGSQETREAKKQTPILTPLDHLGLTYRRLRNKQLN